MTTVTRLLADARPVLPRLITAALAGWLVARAKMLGEALDEDTEFGTTTMRPRLLTWLRSFIQAADRSGALPRLRDLAAAAHEQLSARWPETVVRPAGDRGGPAGRDRSS